MPTVGLVLLGGLHAGAYADFITYELDPVTRHKITLAKTNGAVAPQYAELDLPCTTTFQDLFGGLHYAASTSAGSNVDAGEQYKLIKAKTSVSGAPPPDVFFARIKGKNVPIIDTGVESIPGEPEQSASTSKSTAALTAISALAQSPTAIDAGKKGQKQAVCATELVVASRSSPSADLVPSHWRRFSWRRHRPPDQNRPRNYPCHQFTPSRPIRP
jgi:hypothetical protein